MKASLYTKEGHKKQEVVLNPEIYGVRMNERLLELVRNAYSANLRKGTADTKTRAEVRGGGKKPWKQKGTGNARHGSIRSPIWRGGGTVFGPHPRDYSVRLSQSIRNLALKVMLSKRADEKNLMLLESVTLESAKTKDWAAVLKMLPIKKKKAIYIAQELSVNMKRAMRNLRKWVEVKAATDVSAYDLMQREKVIIDESALALLEKRLGGEKKNEA
ncbi:MAG TPA: 50S ribosomal protein L4 [Candidatus Omnitrophota bacterium]|nr:50S ribosomal protein L4 [Candidatus Omnitrophota bacterium]